MTGERRPELFFYTSSVDKYLQARLVLSKFGLIVQHHRSHVEPYDEDYSGTKENLLTRATAEVRKKVGSSTLIFIEDTSIRIDALSTKDDVPGLRAKEWFHTTTFKELDKALRARGNNRRATVSSDIALSIPGLVRPILIQAGTSGRIAAKPFMGPSSPQYPWLSEKNFSAWFIPDGDARPLSQMDFEESWDFDFRIKALEGLVERLEELTCALNLPPAAYTRLSRKTTQSQMSLFGQERPVLLVIGATCAGKTTCGEYVCQRHAMRHIEASRIVRLLAESHGLADRPIGQFAREVMLEQGPDVIARKILDLIGPEDVPVVITGFRTIEEIELIRTTYASANVIFIDASERTRYERHLKRGRYGSVDTIEKFRRHEDEQNGFGLIRVGQDFADNLIVNEGSIDEYQRGISSLLENVRWERHDVAVKERRRKKVAGSQLFRLLSGLEKEGSPLTSSVAAAAAAAFGPTVRPNNANKVLKASPELARRFSGKESPVRYEITSSGRAYLRLSRRMLHGA